MADYLEAYATRFELPVRTGVRVDRLSRNGNRFVVTAGDRRFEAEQVVVATGAYQTPSVPPFASELDPTIVQMHSTDYRNPSQLREGGVLVVGAGNSGAEIALEASRGHPDLAVRQRHEPRTHSSRNRAGPAVHADPLVLRLPCAHGENADRASGEAAFSSPGDSARAGQEEGSRCCGGRVRAENARCS